MSNKSSKARILALSSRFPFPIIGGDKIRIFNILNLLVQKYEVDLLSISENKIDSEDNLEMQNLGIKTINFIFNPYKFKINSVLGIFSELPLQVKYYYFEKVQEWINKNYKNYDMIFCFHIRMTEYVMNYSIPKIVDLVDAISLNYDRAKAYTSGLWDLIYKIENKRVLNYEIKTINNFNHSLIVSSIDKEFLISNGAEHSKITVVPVGVDENYFKKSNINQNNWIIFIGKMNTVANSDAVIYFTKEIFPLIKRKIQDSEFYIVGAEPTKEVQKLSKFDAVHITGQVKDLTEYIKKAKIVVAPMRFGAGMQNKIIQAMALEMPVITTTIGAEGIDGLNRSHFIIADNPNDFAEACIDLLKDRTLRKQIGNSARELIKQKYTWNSLSDKLFSIIDNVLNK